MGVNSSDPFLSYLAESGLMKKLLLFFLIICIPTTTTVFAHHDDDSRFPETDGNPAKYFQLCLRGAIDRVDCDFSLLPYIMDHNQIIMDQEKKLEKLDNMKKDLLMCIDEKETFRESLEHCQEATEFSHIETRQKLDACEVDILNLISDKTTYVQHEGTLHKFNSTNTEQLNQELLSLQSENRILRETNTANGQLILDLINAFNRQFDMMWNATSNTS